MIPYGRQSIDQADIDAVVEVLRSDWLTQGPAVEAFETALAERVGAAHAVAFSNGTAALHGAMAAAGIGPGDRVLTSPLSFVASANCARYVGAQVGFVDVDVTTWNLDVTAVGARHCDALVAVHYAGLPCDLTSLASRPRVVIEDACHALGARTPDGPVGNCAHSDMTVFSFHPVKAVTSAEGGAVTTNSAELAAALRQFRSHGIVPTPGEGGWSYAAETLGYNFRLSDVHAALGRSQLSKLGSFIALRGALADRYRRRLIAMALPDVYAPPAAMPGWRHAYHLFPVWVPDRGRVYEAMRAAGIGVQVHYVPIYRHPIYEQLGYTHYDYPATERVYSGLLSLPLYPGLSRDQQDVVLQALADAVLAGSAPENVQSTMRHLHLERHHLTV